MWGSDFPASLGKATYAQSLEMVRTVLAFLSAEQRDQILGGTATRLLRAAGSPAALGPTESPTGDSDRP
jgi:predicted TIM-barrel fold metal-dependent hydrolase